MNTIDLIEKRIRKSDKGYFTRIAQNTAILTISLGISSIIILSLSLKGLKLSIQDRIFNTNGHIHITKYRINKKYDSEPVIISQELLNELKLKNVKNIEPFANKVCLIQKNKNSGGILLKGYSIEYLNNNFNSFLKEGIAINKSDPYSKEIIISTKVAKKLNVKLGEYVIINNLSTNMDNMRLSVVGIYETNIKEIDEKVVLCDINLIKKINKWLPEQVGGYSVTLNNYKQAYETRNEILSILNYDFSVQNILRDYKNIFDWIDIMDKNIDLFTKFIFILVLSNIISVIVIQIIEKTYAISVLKVLGANNSLIRNIFFKNTINLIIKGVTYGNFLAIIICLIQYKLKIIKLNPQYYYATHIPINWDWLVIFKINLQTIIITNLVSLVINHIVTNSNLIKSLKLNS